MDVTSVTLGARRRAGNAAACSVSLTQINMRQTLGLKLSVRVLLQLENQDADGIANAALVATPICCTENRLVPTKK